MLFLPLALLAAAASSWSPETEARLSATYDRCMATGEAAKGVTAALMDCTGDEIAVQDARLNRTYRATMARLRRARRATLRTA